MAAQYELDPPDAEVPAMAFVNGLGARWFETWFKRRRLW
jgi:hypothetical protein